MPQEDVQAILRNSGTAVETAGYYDDVWATDNRGPQEMTLPGSLGEARYLFIKDALCEIGQGKQIAILDLGCGSGWLETFISPLGHVTAIDFSPETIARARQQYGEHADFRLADPNDPHLGLPSDQLFDVVISGEVIEHVEEPSALLHQISTFLQPYGYCIMTTPNGIVWPRYQKDKRYLRWHQPIENWLKPRELARLLRQNNFEVVRHEGWSCTEYPYTALSIIFSQSLVLRVVRKLKFWRLWRWVMLYGGIVQFVVAKRQA
jgi:2-polyprenyl-3-methyl-5-hydroxy-6-metoxy-1,4-benzoquinol methylase